MMLLFSHKESHAEEPIDEGPMIDEEPIPGRAGSTWRPGPALRRIITRKAAATKMLLWMRTCLRTHGGGEPRGWDSWGATGYAPRRARTAARTVRCEPGMR